MGHLLGLGRPADVRADPVSALSRRAVAVAYGGRSRTSGASGGDPDHRRRDRSTDHQVLGRLVEHAAPRRLGVPSWRLDDSCIHSHAAVGHGDGVHAVIRHAFARGHAQRNFAAASADAALVASRRGGLSGELKMAAAAHIEFVVASYIAALVVIAALIVWVSIDYRAQRRTLADLE